MPEIYGYVRTSRPRVSELSGSDPETQRQQLLAAGVALSHIYQDIGVSGTSGTNSRQGWHSLDSRLAQGDTLVVVSIDRIGRRWLDTMGNIHDLQRRGVRIRSLADNEQSWAQYLEADPDSPESFMGYTLAGFAAWVSDRELVSIRRRTKAGLEKARADGRKLGAPRRLPQEQEAAAIEMVASGVRQQRRVARSFGVSPAHRASAVVMRSVFQGAVVSTGVNFECGAWWRWQCSRRGVRYLAVAWLDFTHFQRASARGSASGWHGAAGSS